MTQEDKELLLKDLCTRLPYGVKVTWDGKCQLTVTPHIYCAIASEDDIDNFPKILLRPMSSMTEEERDEFYELWEQEWGKALDAAIGKYSEYQSEIEQLEITASYKVVDWLNAHHFDYRCLISKGVAIEALEGLYNLNN